MRLIDADKLVELCRKGWRLFGFHDEKRVHWVDESDIREQPTVEAIPIDYMLAKSQEWLIDRSITGNEMKFIKDLIKEWENESRG